MRLFLDTEFSSLQMIESKLISIAFAAEDEREFYAELPPDSYRGTCSPFVTEVVLPALWGGRYEMPASQLTASLRDWLQGFDSAEIVTDAPDKDFRFLREALNEQQFGWPPHIANGAVYFTPPEADLLAYFVTQHRHRHHALHDARALRSAWERRPPLLPTQDV